MAPVRFASNLGGFGPLMIFPLFERVNHPGRRRRAGMLVLRADTAFCFPTEFLRQGGQNGWTLYLPPTLSSALVLSIFRRVGITPVTVLVADRAIWSMDHDLRPLPYGDFSCPLDCLLLSVVG